MRLKVQVKQMGKRKNSVGETICEIQGSPGTVGELILAVVASQVEEYNRRLEACLHTEEGDLPKLLPYLTREEIADKAESGKVSFGFTYGEKTADLQKAQENALQSFADGIYRIFVDGRPLEDLEEEIWVTEDQVFTFVRLAMLTGRMW